MRGSDCEKKQTSILIDGLIENGDADKFISVLKLMPYSPLSVILRSPGGSITDALAIGRLVRRLLIPTEAPEQFENGVATCPEATTFPGRSDSCYCASACVLIWAAGVPRNIAYILLHRPYLDPTVNARLSLEESQEAEASLRNQVIQYLKDMSVPEKYATDMLSTPSDQTLFINRIQMRDRVAGYPASIDEWLMTKCKTTSFSGDSATFDALVNDTSEEGRAKLVEFEKRGLDRLDCIDNALNPDRAAEFERFLRHVE
jgi:hypothetical protein